MFVTFEEAVSLLNQEKVVAVPTETVYGLAVKYDSVSGIEELYRLKGRPEQKPLTVNLYAAKDLEKFLKKSHPKIEVLLQLFWPGPLTIVVEVKETLILPILRAFGSTCGFRVPDHALTRELIKKVGPIALPSANLSGDSPACRPEEIERTFGKAFPVLEGEGCRLGVASTVVAFQEEKWCILREGAISKEKLMSVLGKN